MAKFKTQRVLWVLVAFCCGAGAAQAADAVPDKQALRVYLDNVFRIMDEHYYLPVSRDVYERFAAEFPADRLFEINERAHKTENCLHLGAGLLVTKLKHPSDRFTNFIPPAKTEAFKAQAYAVTQDLGLEGKLEPQGFRLTRVQKHAPAFAEGIRAGDLLIFIDDESVLDLSESDILKRLAPAPDTTVMLEIFFPQTRQSRRIALKSTPYFKETVAVIDSKREGVLVLKIEHFNQKTSEDFASDLLAYGLPRLKHLLIDLRGNEGGPPLAAREILGFFLPPEDPLFAIARKNHKPVLLTAPASSLTYAGPLTILVNQKTGSAAEMMSGILQAKGLAKLAGSRTAGGAYLKSVYDLDDGALIFMVTSLTFFYDRRVFPENGLDPDIAFPEGADTLEEAIRLLEK